MDASPDVSEQPRIVDVTGLADGSPEATARVAREIAGPCAEWGVFHVVGHGFPDGELGRFDSALRRLFRLPAAAKERLRRSRANAFGYYDRELTKNRPDWKEVFDYGVECDPRSGEGRHSDGANRWPEGESELRATLVAHYRRCERLAAGLLRALCTGLGLRPDRLDGAFAHHTSFQRLNRYAPCPDPAPPEAALLPERGALAVHHHTDAGALTLLYQDDVPGLQVQRGERLVLVEPVPGALTVNLGDLFQVWSNDRYLSPVHRVLANVERERISAPFFWNPDYDAACAPLAELLGPGVPARYAPFTWGLFRGRRSAGDYTDEGEEIQIAHFRVETRGAPALPRRNAP